MRDRGRLGLGLVIYCVVIIAVFQIKLGTLIRPLPLLIVALGTILLTGAQFRKHWLASDFINGLKWNGLISGSLTAVLGILSLGELTIPAILEQWMASLYGVLIFICLEYLEPVKSNPVDGVQDEQHLKRDWESPETMMPFFIERGLSQRECHVATKIIQGSSNKEVADQLFITEATVKKHLQTIYKKTEVSDRNQLIHSYFDYLKQ